MITIVAPGERVDGMPDVDGWTFSRHALQRALDMCLEPEELTACLLRPEIIRPTKRYPEGTRLYVAGRVALAVNVEEQHVITALWATGESYGRNLAEDLERIRDDAE